MEQEEAVHVCAGCGRACSGSLPQEQPQRVPEAAPSHYPRVAGRRPQPSSTDAPQRVIVGSRKVAPSATAVLEERERKKREEEAAVLNAKLRLTRPKESSPVKGPHPGALPSQASAGGAAADGEDPEEEDYYKVSDKQEPTEEERVEAIRLAHQARLEEKHMVMRRRQGVARRPKALVRTNYGQFKSIDNVPAGARRAAKEAEGKEDAEPLLLANGPSHPQPPAPSSKCPPSEASGSETREAEVAQTDRAARPGAPQLVHPSSQLEIDLDNDLEEIDGEEEEDGDIHFHESVE